MNIKDVFRNNEDWIAVKLGSDKNYFSNLSKGQSPKVLYIGCSDSRVVAEEIMGADPGDVFVHRNIANMVVATDLNAMSTIHYAVDHLNVEHIVVCGHYFCGGVQAAMGDADLGVINPWVRNIRDVYNLHEEELEAKANEETRYKRLVELNVQEQCINVMKAEVVQNAFYERGIKVHGWVFDISTGKLIDLNIDSDKILKDLTKLYRLK
jgi:carbonic anhydrase